MNPYQVLGLVFGASIDEIKAAYRKLAMQWHPDRNSSHDAEAQMKRINKAYDMILKGWKPPEPVRHQPTVVIWYYGYSFAGSNNTTAGYTDSFI